MCAYGIIHAEMMEMNMLVEVVATVVMLCMPRWVPTLSSHVTSGLRDNASTRALFEKLAQPNLETRTVGKEYSAYSTPLMDINVDLE